METKNLKFKKIIVAFLYILEIFLITGGYALYYYSKRRMGMMRYLVYLNKKLDTYLLTLDFRVILTLLVLILIIGQIYDIYKKGGKNFVLLGMELSLFLILRKIIFPGVENSSLIVILMLMIGIYYLTLKIKNNKQ